MRKTNDGSSGRRRASRVMAAMLLSTWVLAAVHPAGAASTSSVLVSDSVSTAVGSLSGSVSRGSDSVSRTDRRAAAGEYRVAAGVDIGADRHRLTLKAQQPSADGSVDETLSLELPVLLVQRHRLTVGAPIHVNARAYGLEFAAGQPVKPFFLALEDGWLSGLAARPLDGPPSGKP